MPCYTDSAEIQCPLCQGRADRIRRTTLDRLISLVSPRRRYRCLSPLCTWEGVVRYGRGARRAKQQHRLAPREVLTPPRVEPHA